MEQIERKEGGLNVLEYEQGYCILEAETVG